MPAHSKLLIDTDKPIPFKGGCITEKDEESLKFGEFSLVQNMRNVAGCLETRFGQTAQHTTADGTNKVLSLYQFRKTKTVERRLYAQMSSGAFLEATNAPPAITTGAFGATAFSVPTSGETPASWAMINDLMIMACGSDQHKFYGGDTGYIERLVFHNGTTTPLDMPAIGTDYSTEIRYGDSSTAADISNMKTLANGGAIFIKTAMPVTGFYFAMGNTNSSAAAMSVHARTQYGTWVTMSIGSDGTYTAPATFAKSGWVTFGQYSAIKPTYMYGETGFWYRISVSAALDASVSIYSVKFQTGYEPLQNVWDGVQQTAVEVQVENADYDWETYGGSSVDVATLPFGRRVMVAFTDPVEGIFIDPGAIPCSAAVSLSSIKYWNGSSFVSVGTPVDGTNGLANAGWVPFPRTPAQPTQWQAGGLWAYWYEITWSGNLDDLMSLAIAGMPVFDINDFGSLGHCVEVWKDRACYTFDQYGAYVYVSATGAPMVLNGSDYGILKAGDGRANRVVNMKKFHNELLVFQEEKGSAGGCVTLFEGYSPATFGRLVLSTKIGTFNAKSADVVDGVLTSAESGDTANKTLCFFLSRYGVCVTDGETISVMSDDIQNYFDPTQPECIRQGYESEMWLSYDAAYNVIRVGLVSGGSATACNVFPVFDLVAKKWTFDDLGQKLACMANIEAGSGTAPVVQVGGGTNTGRVYVLNTGATDNGVAIVTKTRTVLNYRGLNLVLKTVVLRFKAIATNLQSGFEVDGKPLNYVQVPVNAVYAGHSSRRHFLPVNFTGNKIVIELQESTGSARMTFYDLGLKVLAWLNR